MVLYVVLKSPLWGRPVSFSLTLSSSAPQPSPSCGYFIAWGMGQTGRSTCFSSASRSGAADEEILWARAPVGNMGGAGGVMLFLRAKLW